MDGERDERDGGGYGWINRYRVRWIDGERERWFCLCTAVLDNKNDCAS